MTTGVGDITTRFIITHFFVRFYGARNLQVNPFEKADVAIPM